MRSLISLLLLTACGPSSSLPNPPSEPESETLQEDALQFDGLRPQNVLMISIDTLRRDHLGLYSDLDLTPFLDRLASEGVRLDDHLQCSSWTFASATCTLAGRSNLQAGYMPRLDGNINSHPPISEGTPFLATTLGAEGYRSLIVSTNEFLSSTWGNTQGYDEELSPVSANAIDIGNLGVDALLSSIDAAPDAPWLLHLHLMEPHGPYSPPDEHIVGLEDLEPFPEDLRNPNVFHRYKVEYPDLGTDQQALLRAHLALLYQGEVRTVDARLEHLWGRLQSEGLLQDTLVVVWTDHGEQLYDRGDLTHGYRLHDEENDGIAFFWANTLLPNQHADPTWAIDIAPTLLRALALPIPTHMTGLPAGTAPTDRTIHGTLVGHDHVAQTVSSSGMKLHYRWNGELSLYDTHQSPHETTDLADALPDEVHALWTALAPQVERLDSLLGPEGPEPIVPQLPAR
jgi:arylsulfatase A-like enzyme